jgi:hypothetical protein
MSSETFYSYEYDENADVLYLSIGEPQPAIGRFGFHATVEAVPITLVERSPLQAVDGE